MSNTLNSENFGDKIYGRFPPKYQEDDVGQNFALKRYLQALSDGGFKYIIEDTNGLLELKDPSRTSLDVLMNLYKQYGLEVFNGIPENYLRSLLPYLSNAWQYKGSIDIIEFITTSLSGIKVSSEVKYVDNRTAIFDEAVMGEALFGNEDSFAVPNITVRLEMDFALSDYFPNSEQFRRILENFVPFYCDLALVYSYVYADENSFIFREYAFDHITDTKTESRSLKCAENFKETMKNIVSESGVFGQCSSAIFETGGTFGTSLFGFIPDTTNIHFTPALDTTKIVGAESVVNKLKDPYAEDTSISLYGIVGEKNSVFGISKTLGTAVFGNEDFTAPTEIAEDKINTVLTDTSKVHSMGTAMLGVAVFNDFLLGFMPHEDRVKSTLSDSVAVSVVESIESVISTMSSRNATMGHALMGSAGFNDKTFDVATVSY